MRIRLKVKVGKRKIDKVVVFLWIAFLLINVFSKMIIDYVGGFGNILLTYAFLLYFLLIYGKRSICDINLNCFLLFVLVYLFEIQFIWETDSIYFSLGIPFKTEIWNMISFVPHTISAVNVLAKSTEDLRVWISKMLKISLLIISIVTLKTLKIDANIVRSTATGVFEYVPFMANYGIVYGTSIILSYLMVKIQTGKKYKIFHIIWIGLISVCIFRCAYLIAIIIAVIGIVCYFLLGTQNKILRYVLISIAILTAVLAYLFGGYEIILMDLAELIPIRTISQRLKEMVIYISSGKRLEATGRIDLYKDAITLFFRHPVIGNIIWNYDVVLSGHSTVLDILGGCGIVGFVPFAIFLNSITQFQLQLYSSEKMRAAIKSAAIAFWLVAILNPVIASPAIIVFFIIGPSLGVSQ